MPDFGPATVCRAYVPGHMVHPIQARKTWEEPGAEEHGTVPYVGDTEIVVAFGSEERRYRNHETGRLHAMLEHFGPEVVLQIRWRVLMVRPEPGSIRGYHFCIARGDEWAPCPEGPPDETIGGFFVKV